MVCIAVATVATRSALSVGMLRLARDGPPGAGLGTRGVEGLVAGAVGAAVGGAGAGAGKGDVGGDWACSSARASALIWVETGGPAVGVVAGETGGPGGRACALASGSVGGAWDGIGGPSSDTLAPGDPWWTVDWADSPPRRSRPLYRPAAPLRTKTATSAGTSRRWLKRRART